MIDYYRFEPRYKKFTDYGVGTLIYAYNTNAFGIITERKKRAAKVFWITGNVHYTRYDDSEYAIDILWQPK